MAPRPQCFRCFRTICTLVAAPLLAIIWVLFEHRSGNEKRHCGTQVPYAHFSAVDTLSSLQRVLRFPRTLLASPREYQLEADTCLFIPKGWWHWVRSGPSTVAVNWWHKMGEGSEKMADAAPQLLRGQHIGLDRTTLDHLAEVSVSVWLEDDSAAEMSLGAILGDARSSAVSGHVITLDAFETGNFNGWLKYQLASFLRPPDWAKHWKWSEHNFWITSRYHDTGLHFDDSHGLLCVAMGHKNVTLFPPSDAPYLYPLDMKQSTTSTCRFSTSGIDSSSVVSMHTKKKRRGFGEPSSGKRDLVRAELHDKTRKEGKLCIRSDLTLEISWSHPISTEVLRMGNVTSLLEDEAKAERCFDAHEGFGVWEFSWPNGVWGTAAPAFRHAVHFNPSGNERQLYDRVHIACGHLDPQYMPQDACHGQRPAHKAGDVGERITQLLQNTTAAMVRYNVGLQLLKGAVGGLSSAHLLFASMFQNPDVARFVLDHVVGLYGLGHLVYGCKLLPDGKMRWEFYVYDLREDTAIAIRSFDVYDTPPMRGPEMHLYHRNIVLTPTNRLPFWGFGTIRHADGTETNESQIYVLDEYDSFAANYDEFMELLGYGTTVAVRFRQLILSKYRTDQLCIHNKRAGQIFVQYLGIKNDDFVSFLHEAAFPKFLVKHVDRSDYRIVNEITLVYDLVTMRIVRGSFYGML